MTIDTNFWLRRRVLLTGHTGFKGAWLSLWLGAMGAEVTGVSAGVPTKPSLYEQAGVAGDVSERTLDVRDAAGLTAALAESRAEVVLHLAAQPMVRRSLQQPALTFQINVMGTVNLLEAVRQCGSQVRSVVVVTSDKCYENIASEQRAFTEQDRLGGADPYSSSKACAELVSSAYRPLLNPDTRLASARAGNVIGGGDWGEDRLLPDSVRAVERGVAVIVRNPDAVRPWQHVLNPLSGYLELAQQLYEGPAPARAFNFGPSPADVRPVGWILARLGELWDGRLRWELDRDANPPEAGHLALDSSAARELLGWRVRWDLQQALERLVEWHRRQLAGDDMRRHSIAQLERFLAEPVA